MEWLTTLRKALHNSASNFLLWKHHKKIWANERIAVWKHKIRTFKYKKKQNLKGKKETLKRFINTFLSKYDVKAKIKYLLSEGFSLLVTGFALKYALTHRGGAISYALLIFIITYYTKWLVKLVKSKTAEINVDL